MREMLIELDVDPTDRRWQERANCLGVDPDLFFRSEELPPRKPSRCAVAARSSPSASSTRCVTARSSGSGAACPSGSAAGSAASGRSCAVASPPARTRRRVAVGRRAHAGLDRRVRVDAGPGEEVVGALIERAGEAPSRRARPTRRPCARAGFARAPRGTRPRSRCDRGRRGSSTPAAAPRTRA